jgi:dihydrofolate synthase/folylpolyglutamate synthase
MSAGPRFDRLEDWLDWQQRLHPTTIELGLERVGRVLERTGWGRPGVPVITVGGTNGKGSTVALLDAVLRAGSHRVGTFTSPHLVDYRERIRLDGVKVDAAALIEAFERIGDACSSVPASTCSSSKSAWAAGSTRSTSSTRTWRS